MVRKRSIPLALAALVATAVLGTPSFGQNQGPSSSQTPYLVPVAPGVTTTSILTVGDGVARVGGGDPYRMVGIPDGLGAYANNDGSFTLLMNHELGALQGIARAHGGTGAFVSRYTIDPTSLAVGSGQDLIQSLALTTPNPPPVGRSNSINLERLCSADLAAASAYFNAATGLGTQERIFLSSEENRPPFSTVYGRSFGVLASGPDTGTAFQLPRLGEISWENAVASPFAQDRTIVIALDDSTNLTGAAANAANPPSEVYVYVGTKTSSTNPVEAAGLTNGSLFGVRLAETSAENRAFGYGSAALDRSSDFALDSFGDVSGLSGFQLQEATTAAGSTQFLRVEDGAWSVSNPNDFYFLTTDQFNGSTRLHRLSFDDILNPEQGGEIDIIINGADFGMQMLDNMTITPDGRFVLMQEDTGNQDLLARIWLYDLESPDLAPVVVAQHDPSRFMPGAANFLTRDEESSGIIPVFDLLGPGWFLADVQAHRTLGGELVEDGQLLALFIPQAIPEPSSLALLGLGGIGTLVLLSRRRRQRA